MSEHNLTLANAIQMAAEAEKKSVELYRDAAQRAEKEPIARLFTNLADFEQHHYDKVTELALSLQKEGKFIPYEESSLSIPAQSEIGISQKTGDAVQATQVSMMGVITMAQNVEQQADKRYSALAEQTTDPDGKAMFQRLAKEEKSHLRLLTEVYWNLNDRGVWAWSKG